MLSSTQMMISYQRRAALFRAYATSLFRSGAAAGLAFLSWALAAGWDVLRFPLQRRRRHSCLAQRLPTGASHCCRNRQQACCIPLPHPHLSGS